MSVLPVQLDVHGLLSETAQFILLLPQTTTQSCFSWTEPRLDYLNLNKMSKYSGQVKVAVRSPTLSQQLVSLAHAVLD